MIVNLASSYQFAGSWDPSSALFYIPTQKWLAPFFLQLFELFSSPFLLPFIRCVSAPPHALFLHVHVSVIRFPHVVCSMKFRSPQVWEQVPTVDWDEKRDMFLRSTALSISVFRRRRYPLLVLTTAILTALLYIIQYRPFDPPPRNAHPASKGSFDGTWNYTRDARNLMLSEAQCELAFPNFYVEIERAVEDRRSNHVTLKELDEMPQAKGYIRAMIYDNQVNLPSPVSPA